MWIPIPFLSGTEPAPQTEEIPWIKSTLSLSFGRSNGLQRSWFGVGSQVLKSEVKRPLSTLWYGAWEADGLIR